MWLMALEWVRSLPVEAALVKVLGAVLSSSASPRRYRSAGVAFVECRILGGGVLGLLLADGPDRFALNLTGPYC